MDTSVFLAKILGLSGAISTLMIITRYKRNLQFEAQAAEDLSSVYSSGFVFLLIGVTLVVAHPVWSGDWRVIITIISWMLMLKGVGRIIFPEKIRDVIIKKQSQRLAIIPEIMTFLLCLYLIFRGFITH